MKDAYGGTFSISLFLVFFVIYVTFIGVALQFAKTYRIKNNVINILEQQQYTGAANDKALTKLDYYLDGVPYTVSNEIASVQCEKRYKNYGYTVHNGVCIVPMPQGSDKPEYFRVEVYFVAEFPFFNISLTIPASGETKIIY